MPNITTIPSSLPFADTLAGGILEKYGRDPLLLANIKILLPNRRACKALQESFLRMSNGKPMLLPDMQPIGDLGDEENIFKLSSHFESKQPEPVGNIETRVILTGLIKKWQAISGISESTTTSQAAFLAIELAAFLEEVERENLSVLELEKIVPEEYASHWQITLSFLNILVEEWPSILSERGRVSLANYRNIIFALQEKYWEENPPLYPIIAAGSTASVPATKKLLLVISKMPNGEVILPGFDNKYLDEKSFEKIEESHPQYSMKNFVEEAGLARSDIKNWNNVSVKDENKEYLVSEIMRPAVTTEQWKNFKLKENPGGIKIVTAKNLREEAKIISLMMKELLEKKHQTAALITNERKLALYVKTIMARWNIYLDDSAGSNLSSVPHVVFLKLIINVFENNGTPVELLSLLKHPFTLAGFSASEFRNNTRELEKKILRGVRISNGLAGIKKELSKSDDKLYEWFASLYNIFEPLMILQNKKSVNFKILLERIINVSEKLSVSNDNKNFSIWSGDKGLAFRDFLDELLTHANSFGEIEPSDFSGIFSAMLSGYKYRPSYGTHPRLYILSPSEARMQHFDLVILGGMNENSWPDSMQADPWMSRPMRKNFGLPLPERKIGLAAHDFCQLVTMSNVVITRAEKVDGAATIPSRFIQKMDVLLSKNIVSDKPDDNWVRWASLMSKPEYYSRIKFPLATPPAFARPKELSVTSLGKLMRDPYAVYAGKILRLKKLNEIDEEPGAADFGDFIHGTIELFLKNYEKISEDKKEAELINYGAQLIKEKELRPSVVSFWWPRFLRIAKWFAENEKERRKENILVKSEIDGKYIIDGFSISAKADRIEISSEGKINIIDYKTGSTPSLKDIRSGRQPQMIVEALIANNNGFGVDGEIDSVEYWKLKGGVVPAEIDEINIKIKEEISGAEDGIRNLLEYFNNANNPYLACPDQDNKESYNDYEHLERLKEWVE